MAFCEVHFRGAALVKWSNMYVLLPDGKGPFPVLYLLHGLSDNHTIWMRRTSIERHCDGLPLIVVMPDGHRSFYVNDPRPGGHRYEDHIVQDVVGFVDRTFPTVARRGSRAIAGLSMGGYGAMMLALRHPDMFRAVCSHSGALAFAHGPRKKDADIAALESALARGRFDCFALARKLKADPRRPAIRIDCGTDDFLLDHNRAFHAHLERLGVPHVYEEYPGAHTWDYWDLHVRDTLKFVVERLGTR